MNNVEDKKKKRSFVKKFVAIFSVLCVFALLGIATVYVVIPNVEYNKAVTLVEAGNVIEAYVALTELDGYKDSQDIAESIYDEYKNEIIKTADVGETVVFGHYEQDNISANGEEEIEWIVLDVKKDKLLLISKYVLDTKKYSDTGETGDWTTSTLREWLNSVFLAKAFTDDEQLKILESTVSESLPLRVIGRQVSGKIKSELYDGYSVEDKVFLLSSDEVIYYWTDKVLNDFVYSQPTEYAKSRGAYRSARWEEGCVSWWSRSNGYSGFLYAQYEPSTDSQGDLIESEGYGVRPAMWIDLNSF